MIGSNAATRVAYLDDYFIPVPAATRKGDPDASALTGEFDGVSDQVSQHVLDFVAVGVNGRQIVAIEPLDVQSLFHRQWLIERPHLVRQLRQREVRARQSCLIA